MTDTKLLPCPFCGSKAEQEVYNEIGQRLVPVIRCQNCRCMGSSLPFVKDIIEAWNNRAPIQPTADVEIKQQTKEDKMTEEQIKYMRDRFLSWKLPKDFHPDCGIQFDAEAAKKLNPNNHTYEPNGTNLFHAGQAEDMIRYMIEGMP